MIDMDRDTRLRVSSALIERDTHAAKRLMSVTVVGILVIVVRHNRYALYATVVSYSVEQSPPQ